LGFEPGVLPDGMTFQSSRRISVLFFMIACPWITAQADPGDLVDWYGTIRFSKRLSEHTSETFPAGHVYAPGSEVSGKDVTWSGSARYLPGRKMVVTASYHLKQVRDRRTDRMDTCPWKDEKTAYHDYELNESETTVSVNKLWDNNRLRFRIEEDGTYHTSFNVSGGNHVPKANRVRARREFFSECSKPHLTVNDQEVFGSDGMEALSIDHIEGAAAQDAQTVSGTWTGKDDDGGDLTYTWELTRAEPVLVARIQASPSPIQRADQITLSASASTGAITRYEWEFAPIGEDCLLTPEGAAARLTGVSVTFQTLCDFTAQLKVSNDQSSDTTSLPITVSARRGEAWKSKFKTQAGPGFTKRVFADEIHFGMNQCSLHGEDSTTGHMIHTDAENNRTWREGGYVLAQVQDAGPFQGAWYVQSQTLRVDRKERVNTAFLPGGEVYQLNQSKNNLRDIQALIEQIRAHEAAHSALVQEKLLQLGSEGDPASRIEKLVGGSGEDAFQFLVDYQVRDVETVLQEATADEQVKSRLRSDGYTREVKIWLPTRPDSSGGPSGEFLKSLGPLWGIGH